MSANWTAYSMATALATAVTTRVASFDPEVRLVTYLPSPEEQFPDAIVIGYESFDSEENQRAHAGGGRFDEEVNLHSRIQVTRPGAGQAVADEARTRAEALLVEVDEEVRDNLPTVGDQTWAGKVIDRDSVTMATNRENIGAVLCVIDFNIQYKARTS
jgi:hypothetical protein